MSSIVLQAILLGSRNTRFRKTRFRDISFRNIRFRETRFRNTRSRNTRLKNTRFRDVNFRKTRLRNTRFRDTRFRNTSIIRPTNHVDCGFTITFLVLWFSDRTQPTPAPGSPSGRRPPCSTSP